MPLSPEEKYRRKLERHVESSRQYTTRTLTTKTARAFQECIRAESGAFVGAEPACNLDGEIIMVHSSLGECVCVTCSNRFLWKGTNQLDTGHYLGGRRNSVLLDEWNVASQCSWCNRSSGTWQRYHRWFLEIRGDEQVERLHKLKDQVSVQFDREQLVRLKLWYLDRTREAKKMMSGAIPSSIPDVQQRPRDWRLI